ncbi:MAG: preprotein translocase subunit SecE [Actinomycetes bacterium]
MAPRNDSIDESLASPDNSADRENLPGELLGEDLTEPQAYQVAPDEAEAEELAASAPAGPSPTVADDVEVDDPAQLAEAETLAQKARNSRPVRRSAAVEVPKKGAATPRAHGARTLADRPTGPITFARESVEELKKVVWPTWPTVQQLFAAVLVFVLVVIAYVGLLDLGFGWVLLRLFG